MAASRIQNIMTDSFLDGITGAALFGKLRIPGAPTVLVDERSPEEAYPEYDALLNVASGAAARPKWEANRLDGQTASFSRSKS
jgi:hypothetical protein